MIQKLSQSLLVKFMLAGSIVIACLCLGLGWHFLHQASSMLKKELARRGLATIENLAFNAEPGIVAADSQLLDRLVDGVMVDGDLVHVIVLDSEERILAERMRTTDAPALPTVPQDIDGPCFIPYETLEGDTFYHAVAPIYSNLGRAQSLESGSAPGPPLGYVQVAFSPNSMNNKIRSVFTTSLPVILCVILAVAALGTAIMSHVVGKVAQPLCEMAERARRMAEGDLSQTVPVNSSDEVGVLARAFNQMSHSLREQTNQLHYQTAQLQVANEALEKANQVKSEFLSNVSHELRTPLTSIRSFSEILMTYADEDPETRQEFVQIINQESERLTRLINDVLDLSKIEAGRMDWNIEPHSVPELMGRVHHIMQGMAEAAGLELHIHTAESLVEVPYDEDRMIQVMTNLVNNAIKFTEEGYVALSAYQEGAALHITVQDTGIGIPSEHLEAIFDKFHQVGNVLTDKPNGTGLGLAICRQIVEHHQGRIWVESTPGEGSCFHIVLPTELSEPSETSDTWALEDMPLLAHAQTSTLILVADDEQNIRRSTCFALNKVGYATLEASTGGQTLDLAQKHLPDLIILDIMMPELDGFDVIKSIRNCKDPQVAAIPILATSILEFEDTALQIGANDYQPKPISRLSLIESVRKLLPQEAERILVVDDEAAITKAVCYELGQEGYHTYAARNGREALTACRQSPPDLIILDVMMPVMNGYEMLKELRQDNELSHIPVIVLTANALPEGRAKALALGAQKYITKGEQFQTLLHDIQLLLKTPTAFNQKTNADGISEA